MTTTRGARTPFISALLITLALGLPDVAESQKAAPTRGADVQWTNLELAVAKAAEQNKAILLDVYTDWCGWCKKMDKEVFVDPAVSEVLAKSFATAKVNGESRESFTFKGQKTDGVGIARAFGVRGYPALIFLDAKGDMLTMIPGFIDAQKFLPVVLFIGNKEYEKMEWEAYLAAYNASKGPAKTPK